MHLSRREFIALTGKIALFLGLENAFPRLAAAAGGTLPIEALRQLITVDPRTSRTIMWQSKTPLEDCRLQYQADGGAVQSLPVKMEIIVISS